MKAEIEPVWRTEPSLSVSVRRLLGEEFIEARSIRMYWPRRILSRVSRRLRQIGWATLVTRGTWLILFLTLLLPPWVKARCQRKELLYFTLHVKDYERAFAGYDFLFAGTKWEAQEPPMLTTPGDTFDVTEYRIFWPVLVVEWVVICFVAVCLIVGLSQRRRVATKPVKGDVQRSASPDQPHV